MLDWSVLLAAVSGLILFLYGMEQFSREVQRMAGENFRSFIRKATKSTPRAFILGCIVTAIAQSSTAVTIITLGLVDSGIMSFTQSLGVMLGASIGTTITAQLVALKFTSLSPVFIPLGFLLGMLGGRFAFLGKPVFFFGLVFFGISMISATAAPLKDDPGIMAYLASLDSIPLALLAGFVLTNLFQSSSVFTGLAVVLAGAEVLSVGQAIPLILGSNIGTLTPLFASVNLSIFSKRAAAAHLLINLGGVMLILLFLHPFAELVMGFGGSPGQQVANAHTLFNVITSAAFLLILGPFAALIERLIPGKEEEILFQTTVLTDKLPEDNALAFAEIEAELRNLLAKTDKMLEESAALLKTPSQYSFQRLLRREAQCDFLDERVERAVLEILKRKLSQKEMTRAVFIVRISCALEQLADLATATGYVASAMESRNQMMSVEARAEIDDIHQGLAEILSHLETSFPRVNDADVVAMRQSDSAMRERINTAFSRHLGRLYQRKVYAGNTYVKAMARMESAQSKLREIRKLCEMYNKL